MRPKCISTSRIFIAFFLLALFGCGNNSVEFSPCFPFACQPLPAVPSVSTNAASNITGDSANLNGTANPNWKDTGARFEWGTSYDMSSYSQTPSQFIGTGDTTINFSYTLTGLTSNTTYYYRAVAYNLLGTSNGNLMSFKTP